MHIKQITISNFRSFRQQPEIHPFSPATNAVVGRNGSGKSNLFDAVQFCLLLSPRFHTLRTEERQALLHEGSGSAAVNAFVEIVFDNSDNRFSMENSDEVVLRRTIGHKKDEFFLQRKRAQKNEIMSLLEGAGFSKSNPYFIVQQGKVNALCTMSDTERLQLLKEVAGTTVYDEKKAESEAKMEENRSNIEKIQEIMSYIEQRLDELKGEKEELTQYQRLDRNRRAIEYTLYDKELRKAREQLDEIESARHDDCETLAQLHEDCRRTHDEIMTIDATMKSKTNMLRRHRISAKGLEDDKTSAVTRRTQLELECKELDEAVRTGDETIKANKKEIERLTKEISKAEAELNDKVQPKYDSTSEAVTSLKNERDEVIRKIEGLYAKQGRGKQFTSREDRDAYLRTQIEELNAAKAEKTETVTGKRDTLSNLRRTLASDTKDLEAKTADVTKKGQSLQALTSTIEEKKKLRNEMAESRKEQWRSLEELNERVSEARDNAQKAMSNMRKVMPRATSQGLDALAGIVQQEGIRVGEQYHGLLLENFDIKHPKFNTAIEVAAENSLFHVVVDTDATAARLMKRLEQDKLGRVTFLPLNRLQVEDVTYPDTTDVAPMITTCIEYDPKVHRAMQHVFGKKLLAANIDQATTWSGRLNMDAITLEGDLCGRKGALTGGYVDANKSRVRSHNQMTEADETLNKLQAEYNDMKRKATGVDQQISALMGEIQRLEAKQANLDHLTQRTEDEIASLQSRVDGKKKQMEQIETDIIPPMETEIKSLSSQVERLTEEMGTELSANLTEEERKMLGELKASEGELDADIETQSQTLEEVSVERQRLQSLLNDNLRKRKAELEQENAGQAASRRKSRGNAESTAAAQERRKADLEQRQRELDEATMAANEMESKLEEERKIVETLRAELIDAKNKLEKKRVEDDEINRNLAAAQEESERLLNKRSMCISRRELYMRKIQELGSLPPTSELQQFSSSSISALMRKLEEVNKKLKKYSHVNKKAYDQFVNFSEQREGLIKRKAELDNGASKVKELIESLDRKKDEAINRTFRGVSAHFKDVFKELCPNGAGELIMRTALDEDNDESDDDEAEGSGDESDDDDDDDDDDSDATDDEEGASSKKKSKKKKKGKKAKQGGAKRNDPKVSLYRGIGVKVRFAQEEQNYLMSQLSGGQKALVALALIFAIQRCDPAPFYLFDELDQALDSTHRAAVASLIQRQANSDDNPTQFICSTFRPELVSVANRCYGISHQNKVSNIHYLSKKDALHFIANLMSEEEAVGDVTSVAPSRASRGRKRKTVEAASDEDGEGSTTGKENGTENDAEASVEDVVMAS